jgi:diguanylate cyclase (GGDEF)-like protein/PAS domain S-box-containing protein
MPGAAPNAEWVCGPESEPGLDALFRQPRWPVALFGADGALLRANEAFAGQFAGSGETGASGGVGAAPAGPDLPAVLTEGVAGALRHNLPADVSGVAVPARPNGSAGDRAGACDFRLEPMRDAAGRAVGVLVLGREVTAQRRAEAALSLTEAEYRLLAEHQSALIVKVDAEGRFQYVNPAYCAMFGQRAEDLLGQAFMPLVHADDRASTAAAMERLAVPPHAAHLEQRAWTVRGWRWLAWQDTALVDEDGRIQAVIGVGHDITDQRAQRGREQRSLENLRAFFSLSQDLLLVIDATGRVREMNEAVTTRLGWRRADLIGGRILRLLARGRNPGWRERLRDLASGRALADQFVLVDGQGGLVPVETRATRGVWDDAPAIFTSSRDLSELSLLREKFERVFLDNATLMAITDPETGRFLDVNSAFLQLLDKSRAEVIGRTTVELGFFPDAASRQAILRDLEQRDSAGPIEMGVKLPDGRHLICEWKTTVISSGGTSYLLSMLSDVTRQHELMRELEHKASHDPLTGAFNRQKGAQILDREILRHRRQGTPLSLILMDVDDFKGVNDQYGHGVGDQVLQALVRTMMERLRETDILARWGGEEFVVILPDTALNGAAHLADSLRVATGTTRFACVRAVTLSLGVAGLRPAEDARSLLNRADVALYQAKRGGRNRVAISPVSAD